MSAKTVMLTDEEIRMLIAILEKLRVALAADSVDEDFYPSGDGTAHAKADSIEDDIRRAIDAALEQEQSK